MGGFPGGPVVKSPPCNAGEVGLIPGQRTKISYAKEQLSPSASTRESMCCNERFHMMQLRPCTAK